MNRYQLYLDGHSVSLLDEFAGEVDVSRSKIIQMTVDRMAEYCRLLAGAKSAAQSSRNRQDRLAGFVDVKTGKTFRVAESIDDMYDTP